MAPELVPVITSANPISDSARFEELLLNPVEFDRPDHITDSLRISFDSGSGGKVRLSAREQSVGKPCFSIQPANMGASNWLSLETVLDVSGLRGIQQVVPVLEAAAAEAVSLFAVVRLTLKNGQTIDTSSTQFDIRRKRRAYSFPISLDDVSSVTLGEAVEIKLIFFIEARDVSLDVYNVMVFGLSTPDVDHDEEKLGELRRLAAAGSSVVRHASFSVPDLTAEEVRVAGNIALGDLLSRFDIDGAEDQFATARKDDEGISLDLTTATKSRWLTLEIRFEQVEDTGGLTALVQVDATAFGGEEAMHCGLMLRIYDETWSSYEDGPRFADFEVGSLRDRVQARLDLSGALPAGVRHHNFGILCYLPHTCDEATIHGFEGFTYDRRL